MVFYPLMADLPQEGLKWNVFSCLARDLLNSRWMPLPWHNCALSYPRSTQSWDSPGYFRLHDGRSEQRLRPCCSLTDRFPKEAELNCTGEIRPFMNERDVNWKLKKTIIKVSTLAVCVSGDIPGNIQACLRLAWMVLHNLFHNLNRLLLSFHGGRNYSIHQNLIYTWYFSNSSIKTAYYTSSPRLRSSVSVQRAADCLKNGIFESLCVIPLQFMD